MIQAARKNCSGKLTGLCPVPTMMNVIMPQSAGGVPAPSAWIAIEYVADFPASVYNAGNSVGLNLGLAGRLRDEVLLPFAYTQGPQVIIVVL